MLYLDISITLSTDLRAHGHHHLSTGRQVHGGVVREHLIHGEHGERARTRERTGASCKLLLALVELSPLPFKEKLCPDEGDVHEVGRAPSY